MFNLIMLSIDWNVDRASIDIDRVFEYTDSHIMNELCDENKQPFFDKLTSFPCLFMNEGRGDEIAYVGHINRPQIAGHVVTFEISLNKGVPPLKNNMIYANRAELHMLQDFEFSRNHWAVKGVDLYRFLFQNIQSHQPSRPRPIVFKIPKHEAIDPTLISAMMPFNKEFDQVYESIKDASENVGAECKRADDIWVHPTVIQDVVSLIDKSRIVVCDCTDRNPNVFYEIGIAHTLGREVILITQNKNDIPFDLQHFRYLEYLNNLEGLKLLTKNLQSRMNTILEQ